MCQGLLRKEKWVLSHAERRATWPGTVEARGGTQAPDSAEPCMDSSALFLPPGKQEAIKKFKLEDDLIRF